jgi:hypothetical protein
LRLLLALITRSLHRGPRQLDEAHADLADDATRTVRIDYRPVHTYTMTNEVKYIAPKARVYREVGDHLKPLWPRQCH